MDLFKSWKRSATFRRWMVFIVLALLLFIGATEKKEATPQYCSGLNTYAKQLSDSYLDSKQNYELCIARGCVVEYLENPTSGVVRAYRSYVQWWSEAFGIDSPPDSLLIKCTMKADKGKWVAGENLQQAKQQCQSNTAVVSTDRHFTDKDLYLCTDAPAKGEPGYGEAYAGNVVCLSWQSPFSSIYDSIIGKYIPLTNCSSKVFILIGLCLFLLLAVV